MLRRGCGPGGSVWPRSPRASIPSDSTARRKTRREARGEGVAVRRARAAKPRAGPARAAVRARSAARPERTGRGEPAARPEAARGRAARWALEDPAEAREAEAREARPAAANRTPAPMRRATAAIDSTVDPTAARSARSRAQ